MSDDGADEMAARMLEEAREDLAKADQKASLLLAALGVGFAAVVGGQLEGHWDSSKLSQPGQIVWWIGVVSAAVAVACSALAIWPRYPRDGVPLYGPTYWAHMAQYKTADDLHNALETLTSPALIRTSHQLFNISKAVLKKYRFVRAALVTGGAAGVLLGVAAVIVR